MIGNRVLIIEQDRRTVDQLQEKLESLGYEAEVALNSEIGLAIVGERRMSAALLDGSIDEEESWDILKDLKSKAPNMAIVLFNGRPRKGESRLARRAGATRFIRRPSDPDKVINTVHQVLSA